jgi:hypothetical protein
LGVGMRAGGQVLKNCPEVRRTKQTDIQLDQIADMSPASGPINRRSSP